MRKPFLALLLLPTLLSGCSSDIPDAIRKAPQGDPTVEQVRSAPERFKGQRARWGGTIYKVTNLENGTRIEIVSRRLFSDGEPRIEDSSGGRFIALFDTFLDPAIYAANRRITVSGTLAGSEEGKVGDYPYRYPVVMAEQHRLWSDAPLPCYDCDPFLYDPWYPYPYYYPRPYLHPRYR